jgi:O-antigen/teichoic acid export membrane protein
LALTHIFFLGLENVVPGEASQRFHQGGIPALRSYLVRIGLALLASTGLVAALAAQFSRPLLNLAYGAADPVSIEALGWYVPIYLLVALALPLRAGLRSLEQTRAIFFAYVLGTTFALLAARALVTDFGVAGVMFGILFNQVVMMIVLMTSLGLACRSERPALEHR